MSAWLGVGEKGRAGREGGRGGHVHASARWRISLQALKGRWACHDLVRERTLPLEGVTVVVVVVVVPPFEGRCRPMPLLLPMEPYSWPTSFTTCTHSVQMPKKSAQ